jgi:hypothetical protein
VWPPLHPVLYEAGLRAVLDRYAPGPVAGTVTCMHTLTPDENFVLDPVVPYFTLPR